jgi:hypothetical protein
MVGSQRTGAREQGRSVEEQDQTMMQIDRISWKKLLAEFATIVGSILLAFAIDAGWDEHKERQYEQEVLASLESEYENHRKSIEAEIALHKDLLGAVGRLMAACQTGTYTATDLSLDDALYSAGIPVTTDLGSGVRDSLISAGRIEVLSDPELRYALSRWDSVLLEVTDGQMFSYQMVRETYIPMLAARGIAVAHGMRDEQRNPWPLPTRPIAEYGDMEARLLADPEFCTLLDFRYMHMSHTLDEYDDLLQAIIDILGLIRGSQDRVSR